MTINGNPQDQLGKVSSEMYSLSSLWGRYPTNNPFLFGIVWIRLPICCLIAFFKQTNNQVGRLEYCFVLCVLPRWCVLGVPFSKRPIPTCCFFRDVALSPVSNLEFSFLRLISQKLYSCI